LRALFTVRRQVLSAKFNQYQPSGFAPIPGIIYHCTKQIVLNIADAAAILVTDYSVVSDLDATGQPHVRECDVPLAL
jgi:hypothetical protein